MISVVMCSVLSKRRGEQRYHQGIPFGFERPVCHWLARAAIPICGIRQVAFFAMQISMHPRTGGGLLGLGMFVGGRPIALGIIPERLEGVTQLLLRCAGSERCFELCMIHSI